MIIECACGCAVRGSSENELVAAARLHIQREHRELGEPPCAADILAMASDEPIRDGSEHASIRGHLAAQEQSQCGT